MSYSTALENLMHELWHPADQSNDTRSATASKLRSMCARFIKTPQVESEAGGWAPVDSDDLDAFGMLISCLIHVHWGMDCDGDVPVEFVLVNRTKHERSSYEAVAYRGSDRREALLDNMLHGVEAFRKERGMIRRFGLIEEDEEN